MGFWYKILFELINLVFNNKIGFFFVGQFGFADALFVMYPADQGFADYYTFRFRQQKIKLHPFLVGWIVHPSGKRTLQFAVSTFFDSEDVSSESLRIFYEKVKSLKSSIGAKTAHFAGTLPGRFSKNHVHRGNDMKNERVATAKCVVEAVLALRDELGHNQTNDVVILGSRGFVGREVVSKLKQEGVHPVEVDLDIDGGKYVTPQMPHVVVNITLPGVIASHLDVMNEHTCLLNEVYPAPSGEILDQLRIQGVQVHHLAGVVAHVFPPFPKSYQGAVPCCAALNDEEYVVRTMRIA